MRTYGQAFSSFQQSLQSGIRTHGAGSVTSGPAPVEPGYYLQDGAISHSAITKAQLEAWIVWLRTKGVTPGGVNMYLRTINSFLSWLASEGYSKDQLRLKLLPNPSKPLKGFSDNEIRSLLSFRPSGFIGLRTYSLLKCLIDTGIRIEEALTILKRNVDLDNLLITVKGKGNKERKVPISIELRKQLFQYSTKAKSVNVRDSEWFFSTRSGHRLSYRNSYRDLKALCAKAGVSGEHVHPHALRHCFAVTYIRRGGDIYRLSRILGHTSISTTQIYLRSMGIEQIAENHSSLSPLSRQ